MSEERGSTAARRTWRRYVAVGDSFTEGIDDPDPSRPGAHRGWADRLAALLDADARAAGGPGLEYANLAVRGRLLGAVLDQQLPVALASGADLVSLSGGGNDLLRPGADVDALAARLDDAVAALRATGADVLLTAGFDPRALPVVRWTRGRVAVFNLHLWSIAQRRGAHVLDLWSTRALYDPRLWVPDRIHLAPEGHRRVALLAAATLRGELDDGRELDAARAGEQDAGAAARVAEWARPLPPLPAPSRAAAARADLAWARTHLLPWVQRRVRGRSSGDAVTAKRPEPALLEAVGG